MYTVRKEEEKNKNKIEHIAVNYRNNEQGSIQLMA